MQIARRPAQGLLEMVIAIAVILTSTLATTTLIYTTLRAGQTSQTRVSAANFAREGVEIVRSVRDGNWLKADQNVIDGAGGTTVQWDDTGATNDGEVPLASVGSSFTYLASFDPVTNLWSLAKVLMTQCSSTGRIFQVTSNGTTYFTQSATGACPVGVTSCTPTAFTRRIQVSRITDTVNIGSTQQHPDYLQIDTTVCASSAGLTKPLVASERLYNWK